ncbi:uncharacterized protein LOC117329205 isoform X2 [Pecten maximus]|uniref:uncharacterized protein LOC117329205 isoform X2 n=1 Tax=Pecten maximus TaxID=6579 RepID=UPI00145843FE|nr:uncharacterized protein LOC117329205 isoform X2 [Pecten maximus]
MKRKETYIMITTYHVLKLIVCIWLLMEINRRKKSRRKTMSQSNKYNIQYLRYYLGHSCSKYIKQYRKLSQFLDRGIVPYIRLVHVYIVQLPPRLHVNNQIQRHDGETVFPRLIWAYQTGEGLKIDVPADLQYQNNPFTAIRVRVRNPVGNTTEVGTRDDNRDGAVNLNGADNREAVSERRNTDYRDATEDLNANLFGGIDRLGRQRRGMILVEVCYRGSNLHILVRKGTPVSEFIRSREFGRKVFDKWNIPEDHLNNMILRHGDQVIETLEIDCTLRLTTGHLDLFIQQYQRTNN